MKFIKWIVPAVALITLSGCSATFITKPEASNIKKVAIVSIWGSKSIDNPNGGIGATLTQVSSLTGIKNDVDFQKIYGKTYQEFSRALKDNAGIEAIPESAALNSPAGKSLSEAAAKAFKAMGMLIETDALEEVYRPGAKVYGPQLVRCLTGCDEYEKDMKKAFSDYSKATGVDGVIVLNPKLSFYQSGAASFVTGGLAGDASASLMVSIYMFDKNGTPAQYTEIPGVYESQQPVTQVAGGIALTKETEAAYISIIPAGMDEFAKQMKSGIK